MLLAGMDVSGNPREGNYKFMGIIIGTKENLNSMIKHLELDQFETNTKNTRIRSNLVAKLEFDCKDNIAFCVRVERDRIIENIKKRKKTRRIKHEKIFRAYNNILFNNIRKKILEFTYKHNCSLSDVIFQCDSDCERFATDNGLRHSDPKHVHTLCDLVAWSNNKDKEPNGVISICLTDIIETEMKRNF